MHDTHGEGITDMRVKVEFTVDVNYADWTAIRELANSRGDVIREASPQSCRDNIRALAEEGMAAALEDYVGYQFI